jgi:outer membrane lipoprotein SlyB
MTLMHDSWRRFAAALAAGALLAIAGCSTPPAYQVVDQPSARIGTVDSIQQEAVQNVPSAVGAIGGALVGGGFVGNEAAKRSQTMVWRIGVRYDDGSIASIQQTAPPNLRIGDRVRVTGNGIELLRR